MNKIKLIFRKSLLYFTMVMTVLMNFNLPVKADVGKVTIGNRINYSYDVTDSAGTRFWTAFTNFIYSEGEIAFCVEPALIVDPNANYQKSDYSTSQRKTMEYIAYVGWATSAQTAEDYFATQLYIWETLGTTINSTSFPNYASKKELIRQKVNKLFGTKPSFNHANITLDVGESTTLTDTNGIFENYSWISNSDGISVSKNGNNLTITAGANAPEDSSVSYQLVKQNYVGTSVLYSSNAAQNVVSFKLSDPSAIDITIKVNKFGSLKLAKQDEDGNFVPNTTFSLSYQSDMSSPIGSYTTGSDGTITIDNLNPQTVYIQETAVPTHLVLDSTIYSMTIQPNETVSYTAKNDWIKGKVKLRKVDSETNEQVGGATYAIYDDKGQELQRLVTTASGFVESGYLRFGDYTVKEVIAPTGYVLNDHVYSFSVSTNEQRIEVTGEDRAIKGYLQVIKKDADTGKTITKANTTFNVYRKDGSFVERITTNRDGKATTGLLRYGEYYLVEETAPDGYVHSDERITYQIQEDGKTYVAEFSNKRVRASLTLTKEDVETGSNAQGEGTLEGAVYGLFARKNIVDPANGDVKYKAGESIAELKTNQDAKASINDLYLGEYYLKEITPSKGYTLDPTEYDVVLQYQNQTVEVITKAQTVKEKVISQAFSIIKISDNGSGEADLLQGVEFTIKSKKDIETYGSWEKAPVAKNAKGKTASTLITDEKGYALSDELPFGTYIVRETKTPEDHYQVPDFTVTITKDSRDPQPWRIFNDEKFKAVVAIVKQDEETKETIALSGAKFKIWDIDNKEYVGSWVWNPLPHYVDCWESNDEGMVMTDDMLKPGNYQLEEVEAPEGYLLNETPIKFTVSSHVAYETLPDGTTPVITVKMMDAQVKGILSVSKEGEVLSGVTEEEGSYSFVYEKRKLKDAVFEIYAKEVITSPDHQGTVIYQKDELVETLITQEDGIAKSKELPLGTYYVKEKMAPIGYVQQEEVQEVTLAYQDQHTALVFAKQAEFDNERQKVAVNAHKVDEVTKEAIPHAEFSLYANRDVYNYDGEVIVEAGTLLQMVETNMNGNATFTIDLPNDITPEYSTMPIEEDEDLDQDSMIVGDMKLYNDPNSLFYIKETRVPAGYVTEIETRYYIDTKYTSQEEQLLSFGFLKTNKKTEVEILKTDEQETPLEGTILALYDDHDQLIEQWETSTQTHTMLGLIVGETYRLKEIKASDGYTLADDIEFVVKDTKETQRIIMKNAVTEMAFEKIDKDSKEPLVGASLSVFDEDGTKIEEWISDGTTHVIKGLIEHKNYHIKELNAPYGYAKIEDIVFVAEDKQQVIIENELIRKDIVITKVDETDEKKHLAGAQFVLYEDEACTKQLQQVTSDEEGIAVFSSLLYGTYYIKEVEAPSGYEITTEVKTIIIDETNQPLDITWSNKRKVIKRTVIVHSGDSSNMTTNILLLIGSFAIIFLLFIRKKRKNG